MFRSAAGAAPRQLLAPRLPVKSFHARRYLTTASRAQKSRSWKSSAARWALALGGVYYYNTSSVFAEEPDIAISRLENSIHNVQESSLPTLEALAAEKRERQAEREARDLREAQATERPAAIDEESEEPTSVEDLEDEADQQGAFNPETGEINWDCPCLGGMAHGPCGEEFKAAFSCFVHSKEEPKGMECIEKFKGMQECFREHPDIYGSELEDDEDEVEEELEAAASSQPMESPQDTTSDTSDETNPTKTQSQKVPEPERKSAPSESAARSEAATDEGSRIVPKVESDEDAKTTKS